MRHITKNPNSQILLQKLRYPTHKKKIREILEGEQEFYCAYTEDRISPTFADDVEHFDATLKGTSSDGYNNWYAASARWNHIKKDEQWSQLQPILYPTDSTLEGRLTYYQGFYLYHSDDTEAKNLSDFLDLNNYSLVIERRNYVIALKDLNYSNSDLHTFLATHPVLIRFRRAIEKEFNISL